VAAHVSGETLFSPALTRPAMASRYTAGARITAEPSVDALPRATDLLFLIRPEGVLVPATASRTPAPQPGDIQVLLSSAGTGPQP
jgi:hypothetical protein